MKKLKDWWLKEENRGLRILFYTFITVFGLLAVGAALENHFHWFPINLTLQGA